MKKTLLPIIALLLLGLSTLQAKELVSLYITVEPSDARIRILNIKPKFYDGIQLKKDKKYHLRIDKRGYSSINKWFTLNEDKELNFTLEKKKETSKNTNNYKFHPAYINGYMSEIVKMLPFKAYYDHGIKKQKAFNFMRRECKSSSKEFIARKKVYNKVLNICIAQTKNIYLKKYVAHHNINKKTIADMKRGK